MVAMDFAMEPKYDQTAEFSLWSKTQQRPAWNIMPQTSLVHGEKKSSNQMNYSPVVQQLVLETWAMPQQRQRIHEIANTNSWYLCCVELAAKLLVLQENVQKKTDHHEPLSINSQLVPSVLSSITVTFYHSKN